MLPRRGANRDAPINGRMAPGHCAPPSDRTLQLTTDFWCFNPRESRLANTAIDLGCDQFAQFTNAICWVCVLHIHRFLGLFLTLPPSLDALDPVVSRQDFHDPSP